MIKSKLFKNYLLRNNYKILLAINNKNIITDITKITGITYSHTNNIISIFEEKRILIKHKQGRITIPELTKKGKMIKEGILIIKKALQK